MELLNTKIFLDINQFAGINPYLDSLGKVVASYMPIIFVLWLTFLWFSDGRNYRKVVLYGLSAAALGLLLNLVITKVYYHPRPFMIPVGKLLIPHAPETSFPSDHTTFMLSVAIMLIYFRATRISGSALFILGLLGGLARVYCGLHFPLDIVGSLGVAIITASLLYLLRHALDKVIDRVLDWYDAVCHRVTRAFR